jgi:hypothetical protein
MPLNAANNTHIANARRYTRPAATDSRAVHVDILALPTQCVFTACSDDTSLPMIRDSTLAVTSMRRWHRRATHSSDTCRSLS